VGLITRTEEPYRVWCVCDREASITRKYWPTKGCCAMGWRVGGYRQHLSLCCVVECTFHLRKRVNVRALAFLLHYGKNYSEGI
jgi:hypothetical protein